MVRGGVFGHRALRCGIIGLVALSAVAAFTDNADARRGRRPAQRLAKATNPPIPRSWWTPIPAP